jgi:hypothetical protein
MHTVRVLVGISLCLVMSSALSQTQNVRVQLNETGIAEWSFLSPKTPHPIGIDQTLEFVNTTSGRTFIVNIPFEFRAEDLDSSYSVAAVNRKMPVAELVNGVLHYDASDSVQMSDKLEVLRMLDERVKAAKDASNIVSLTAVTVENLDANTLETLYWTAACGLPDEQKAALARGDEDPLELRLALNEEAKALVERMVAGGTTMPRCLLDTIDVLRSTYKEITPVPGLDTTKAAATATTRFAGARIRLAKNAMQTVIKKEIQAVYESETGDVLNALESLRLTYEKAARQNEWAKCRLYFVRAAATLTATYGPDGKVPFSSPILSIDPRSCDDLSRTRAKTDMAIFKGAQASTMRSLGNVLRAPASAGSGTDIADCTGDPKVTCTARVTVPPNQRAVLSRSILDRRSDRVLQFTVSFFDEAEPPANATGYAFLSAETAQGLLATPDPTILARRREATPSEVPPKLAFNFAADAGADYALPDKEVVSHVRRTTGAGALGFQYIGPFDLSATLQFKKGEFGGAPSTNQVQASQYQAKVFGPLGTVFEYGKFTFAKPSSGIAISEAGEGLRFGVRRFNLGYVIRRESDNDKQIADRGDDDSYALISQISVPVPILRSLVLTGVWGNEKKDVTPATNLTCTGQPPDNIACSTPYEYGTLGFDTRFSLGGRFPNFVTTVAAYHSVRNLRTETRATTGGTNFTPVSNGKGDVALMTFGWSRLIEQNLRRPLEQSKPWFSLTGFLGYGSADNPKTKDRDESYLGENAGYTNDKLFLSTVVGTKSLLGKGLANKLYAAIQYSNATWSPLAWVATLLGAENQVESRSTTITLHKYHLIRDINCDSLSITQCDPALAKGQRNAGWEADLEFLVETPKNVRWTISGAWYRRSPAMQVIGINHNPWTATANVSIKLPNVR